jgi:hypothetical protein
MGLSDDSLIYTKDPLSERLPVDNHAFPTANTNCSRRRSVTVTLCCLLYMIIVGRLLSTGLDACFKWYGYTFLDSVQRNLEVSGRRRSSKDTICLYNDDIQTPEIGTVSWFKCDVPVPGVECGTIV